jgi:hypothetical protein
MRLPLFVIAFLVFHHKMMSQNLSGTWSADGGGYKHKLVVVQKDSLLAGYVYEKSIGYCTADFEGVFYTSNAKVKGEGVKFITKSLLHTLSRYDWKYVKDGSREYLIGAMMPKFGGGKVFMQLTRNSETVDTTSFMAAWLQKRAASEKVVPVAKDPVVSAVTSEKKNKISDSTLLQEAVKRSMHLNDVISVDTGAVLFTLYDNGTFDHDSVTIIHNGIILLQKQEVSLTPLRFSVTVDKENPSHEIILFAENEGTIPPNTALLIIESKGLRYQLNLSSSLKTNEKIIVKMKE